VRIFLVVFGLVAGLTCSGFLIHRIGGVSGGGISPDGSTSSAPSGPALVTLSGIWTWDGAAGGRPGEYNVLLNGSGANGGIGNLMEVNNGGQFYIDTVSLGWFVWNSGTQTYSASSGPTASPTAIAPTSATVSDTASANSVITGLAVTMSDGGIFTGTCSKTSGSTLFAITAGCNLTVGSSNLTPTNDGTYTIGAQATVNGRSLPSPQSITVTVSAGMACFQGPNFMGTLPSDVTRAGFTTCALNADFTTSTTDGNGIKYSDITTWISECGAPSRTYNFHIQYWYNITTVPCGTGASGTGGRATIKTDPLGGSFNILDIQYLLTDQTLYLNYESGCGQCGATYNYSDVGLSWPSIGGGSVGLPYEMYIEVTFAAPTATMNAKNPSAPGTAAFFPNSTTVTSIPPQGSQAHIAVDQFEIVQNATNSGASTWLWTSGWSSYLPNNTSQVSYGPGPNRFQDFTGYHAYGQLMTSDEVKYFSVCSYIDGVQVPAASPETAGCQPGGSTGGNIQAGAQCSGGGWACYFGQNSVIFRYHAAAATCLVLSTTPCYSNDLHEYVKSIRIFTCSNYQSGQCPGTVITAQNSTAPKHYANDNSPDGLIRQAVAWLLGKAA
jgi:hypothetical protein